jgi:hypothetical protein
MVNHPVCLTGSLVPISNFVDGVEVGNLQGQVVMEGIDCLDWLRAMQVLFKGEERQRTAIRQCIEDVHIRPRDTFRLSCSVHLHERCHERKTQQVLVERPGFFRVPGTGRVMVNP